MKYKGKQMLSGLVTTSMLFAMLPVDVLAAQQEDVVEYSVHMISGFASLSENVEQQMMTDVTEADVKNLVVLPTSLLAYETVLPVMQENVEKEEQNTSESLLLSPDTAQKIQQNPITIENVTWEGTQIEDSTQKAVWEYTPVLPQGYVVAQNVEMPKITVVAKKEVTQETDAQQVVVPSVEVQEPQKVETVTPMEELQEPVNTVPMEDEKEMSLEKRVSEVQITGNTDTDRTKFINAAKAGNQRIVVKSGVVLSLQGDTKTDTPDQGRMHPVLFAEGTEVVGEGDAEISFRSPIQLTGDNVCFRNIKMTFSSTNALGSVPHREIFLAGYSLTLDNVNTWKKGGLGTGFGGDEAGLFPSVFAGAYPYISESNNMGSHAKLTVLNAPSKSYGTETVFQNIYLSNSNQEDGYAFKEYNGKATLDLCPNVYVRNGRSENGNEPSRVYSVGSQNATIQVRGASNKDKVGEAVFEGDENTTLTFDNIIVSKTEIKGDIEVALSGKTEYTPMGQNVELNSLSLPQGTNMSLVSVDNLTINGDFKGGGEININSNGLIDIKGKTSGQTTLTGFINYTNPEHVYVRTAEAEHDAFRVSAMIQNNGKEIYKKGNNWMIYNKLSDNDKLGSIIIKSEDNSYQIQDIDVDTTKIQTDGSYLEKKIRVICKKQDGRNEINSSTVQQYGLLDNTIAVKTKYWNEKGTTTHDDKTDWASDIGLVHEGNASSILYHLQFPKNQPKDDYTLLVFKDGTSVPDKSMTFGEMKAKATDSTIAGKLDIHMTDGQTGPAKITIQDGDVKAIPDQTHTGKPITPEITVTVNQKELKQGTDYEVTYENNTEIGNTAVAVITGKGEYTGTVRKNFKIVAATPTTTELKAEYVKAIPDQAYTGEKIEPNVVVTVAGQDLTVGQDYEVTYKNNTDIGTATAIIKGIGKYRGEVSVNFAIKQFVGQFTLTADKKTATYGESITFTFKVKPMPSTRRVTPPEKNKVSIYCGDTLLGTANVVDNQATLIYDTKKQGIPAGKTSRIHVMYGGSEILKPNTNIQEFLDITLHKQLVDMSAKGSTISLSDFTYDGTRKQADVTSIALANQTSFTSVIGKATLPSAEVGTYDTAILDELALHAEDSKWYELNNVVGKTVQVSPAVRILQAEALQGVSVNVVTQQNQSGNVSLAEQLPDGVKNGNPTYTLQDNQSQFVDVKLENGVLTYTPKAVGKETVTVIVKSKNYKDMTLRILFEVTDKEVIHFGLTAENKIYDGKPYAQWKTTAELPEGYNIEYRNVDQNKVVDIPKDAGNYAITVSFENDTKKGKETQNFSIIPKEVHLQVVNKEIKVGDVVPSLEQPQMNVDYNFETGFAPLEGEHIGIIRMQYNSIPDNSKEGTYQILAEVIQPNKNYQTTVKAGQFVINKKDDSSSGGGGSSSGGGGSSSGGGGGAASKPSQKPSSNKEDNQVSTITPDKNQMAFVTTQSIKDQIQEIQKQEQSAEIQKDKVVTIQVENAQKEDTVTTVIPDSVLDILVEADAKMDVVLKGAAEIAFDKEILTKLYTDGKDGDLIIKIEKQDDFTKETKNVVSNRPVYNITLNWRVNGQDSRITDLKGQKVKISLPYTPASNENIGKICAVYINDKGETQWITNSYYNAEKGAVEFITNHFSVYGVGYLPDAPMFTDITGHWAKEHIDFVTQYGLLKGTGSDKFSPNMKMTRGMFVTALGRLSGVTGETAAKTQFTDVPSDAYYAPYVAWAAENGIVNGRKAHKFAPEQPVTRQEMAVILKNFTDNLDVEMPVHHQEEVFYDEDKIKDWASDAIHLMQKAGILYGKENHCFDPNGTATRAEVSAVLRRIMEYIPNHIV